MSTRTLPRVDGGRDYYRESQWTQDEYAFLGRLLRAAVPFTQAAHMLGRTISTMDRRSRVIHEHQREEPVLGEPPRYCEGCGKPLSLYNPRPECWACQGREAA